MADIALDNEHDLLITDDALTLVTEDSALVQHLTIRLRFFLGEWFLDQRVGVPYFQDVLKKNPNLVFVRGLMRQTILTTPGVQALETFDFVYDNAIRKMSFTFTVRKTADGLLLDYSKEFVIA